MKNLAEKGRFKSPSTWVFSFVIAVFWLVSPARAQQDSLNATKLGHLSLNWGLAGVWGYTDTLGNEYALVGTEDGMDVVNVTNPANPTLTMHVPGAYSLWREIKTYKNFAFVIHDIPYSWNTVAQQGIQIVNLDSLTTPVIKRFRPSFNLVGSIDSVRRAHTLWIDENGVLYVFGSNLFGGGVLMFDLEPDPWNPQFLGGFNSFYMHDGYVRDNILYAAAILDGFVAVIDVGIKSNPTLLKTFLTPNQFAHNTWLSDDGKNLFTTDEVSGAFIASYDVSDFNNITELHRVRTLPGSGVIPHNVQVVGNHLVTSYYTRGVIIHDAKYPDLMVEVGYYDTSPQTGSGFFGAWGAYPYLPSGNILVSDMQQGLFIIQTVYPEASRVYGIVKDSLTGQTLFGADIELAVNSFTTQSAIDGTFKHGLLYQGWDTVDVTLAGYFPAQVAFQFVPGNYDTVVVSLLPLNFRVEELAQSDVKIYPNPSCGDVFIEWLQTGDATVSITNMHGAEVLIKSCHSCIGFQLKSYLPSGVYVLHLEINGEKILRRIVIN